MPFLTINGEQREFSAQTFPATLSALLAQLRFDSTRVVAEVNGTVVSQAEFATHLLHEGQTVELVSFVGGG